jgi:glycosyltransferase involved in cell wall biosynthesis
VTRDRPPLRVGYILRKFPALSETFVLNELLALEERGVQVHVFSLQRPNDPRFHDGLSRLKARVSYVPEVLSPGKLLRHNRRVARSTGRAYWKVLLYAVLQGKVDLLWRLLQAGYVANEARRLKLTRLHAQFANRPATVANLASAITGIPYGFTAHATDIFKKKVGRRALVRKMREADLVITVSEFNRRFLEEIDPASRNKIALVYNGIDMNRFDANGRPPGDLFRFVTVARLVEKKGLPVLVEACRLLKERGVSFRCDLVGKGILRSELRRRIQAAGLEKTVRMVGPMTQREVLHHYHASHAYVLPSIVGNDGNREGLPVSLVEALACGLPVITTPLTGIPEAVRDGENGFLVPSGDAAALARAMETLIRDRRLYRKLADNARPSVVERFDRNVTSDALHRLLDGTLGARTAR